MRGDLLRLIYEGFAVGTLDFGRIGFMGTDLNLIQCAVIFALGVMSAVVDSTSDGFVLVGHHKIPPLWRGEPHLLALQK